MAQLAQITATANVVHSQLKTLSESSTNSKYRRENITVGSAGEIYLVGAKHALQINQAKNMRPNTRTDLGATKRGENGG